MSTYDELISQISMLVYAKLSNVITHVNKEIPRYDINFTITGIYVSQKQYVDVLERFKCDISSLDQNENIVFTKICIS